MVFSKKILTIVLAVILVGVLAFFLYFNKSKEPAAAGEASGPAGQAAKQKPEEMPLPVKAAPVIRADLIMKLKTPGEAVTEKKATIKAEVTGVLKNIQAAEGKHVREGEILAEIDDQDIRLKLERYEASRWKALSDLFLDRQFSGGQGNQPADPKIAEKVNKTREAFDKAGTDFVQGRVPREDMEKAQRDYEMALIESGVKKDDVIASSKGLTSAEIDVKTTKRELEKTEIRAPFDGIVTEIKVSVKENVAAGRDLFTVVNISTIKVVAKVLESEVGKIKIGREAALRFSAYPGKVFKGRVEAVSPIINPEDKTCAVHIVVPNPQEELKPGMHAEVEIVAAIFANRLLVPHDAVLVRAGRKLVFVVEGGLAKWRYIQAGLENEEYVEILEENVPDNEKLKEGEQVITEGHITLAHDAKVQITGSKGQGQN